MTISPHLSTERGSSGLASRVTGGPSDGTIGIQNCASLETLVLEGLVNFIVLAFIGSSQTRPGFLSEGSLEATFLPVLY